MRRYRITIVLVGIVGFATWLILNQKTQLRWSGAETYSVVPRPPTLDVAGFLVDLTRETPVDGVLTARFSLRNIGEGTLIFSSIRASCACAAASISTSALRGGEEAELVVHISSEKSEVGGASVFVGTNDPTNPSPVFHVKWDPKSIGFAFEPRNINFGRVTPHSTQKRLVRMRGALAESFTGAVDLVAPDANKGVLEMMLDTRNNALMIALTSGSLPGVAGGALVARSPGGARISTCPLSWEVVPEVEASPAELYLGIAAPGDRLAGLVALKHISGLSPEVVDLEFVPDDFYAAARLSKETQDETTLQVEVVVPDAREIVRTNLRVRCQVFGRDHQLEIPVFIAIRRS